MSVIDEVLADNREFAEHFSAQELPARPARHLAVVACMDYRKSIERMLGLKIGDANIIRNAGGIITEDALRSLIISHHLLDVREVMIINHTRCGMLKFRDEDLLVQLQRRYGTSTVTPAHFYAFTNLENNVRVQVQRVKSHPWLPPELVVRGFIYDVDTGLLNEVID